MTGRRPSCDGLHPSPGDTDMHVRALRGFHHGFGVKRGQVIEVQPHIGAQLVAIGLLPKWWLNRQRPSQRRHHPLHQ